MDVDNEPTLVIFRRFRSDREIIALFPEINEGQGDCSSYQRVGQHGSAAFKHVLAITDPVPGDDEETRSLSDELTGLGYVLSRVDTYPIPPLPAIAVLFENVASCYDW